MSSTFTAGCTLENSYIKMITVTRMEFILSSKIGGPWEAVMDTARALRFAGVEWDLNIHAINMFGTKKIRLSDDLKHFFHAPWKYCNPFSAEQGIAEASMYFIEMMFKKINELNGHYVVMHISGNTLSEEILDTAYRIVKIAEEYGITIAYENLRKGISSDPEKMERILATSGARMVFDIGHAAANKDKIPVFRYFNMVKKYIIGTHLYGIETKDGHVPLMERMHEKTLKGIKELNLEWNTIELTSLRDIIMTRKIVEEIISSI